MEQQCWGSDTIQYQSRKRQTNPLGQTAKAKRKLSLDRAVTYQIKVPGQLDERWQDWVGEMTITVEGAEEDAPVTTLTGAVDQAALQGLLRRLYSLGLPLISVNCVGCD